MEIDFLQYKVRNGDTLKSIASRLGMTGEELKSFHNSRCERMDTIWFENLNEVKSIFVPLDFKTEKQKKQEEKTSLPSQSLDSFFAETYNVTESFESPLEKSINIHYTLNINVRKDKNKNLHILSYTQGDFTSNGNVPEDKIGDLAIACMKSIMPIEFHLNDQGRITGFADHKKITQTFAEQRRDLDFFTGEIFQSYMDRFERNIGDEKFFLQQLQSTLLFQTLFPKMEWFQKKIGWSEAFYLFQNSFPVQCNMYMEQERDAENQIITIIRGDIAEFYSLQELRTGRKHDTVTDDPISGEIILEYTIHKKNKTLLQAQSTMNLWREDTLIQQHTITITQG